MTQGIYLLRHVLQLASTLLTLLYVFVVMKHATRRILHVNVTAHPTAQWTIHQLREAIPADHSYRFLIHDRGRAEARGGSVSWSMAFDGRKIMI